MADKPHHAKPKGSDEEIARLTEEARQAQEQYLRTLADFENTKKRLNREKEEFARFAAEGMARQLLPILDSLDQALVVVAPSTRPAKAELAPRPASIESRGGRDSAPRDVPAELHKPSDWGAVVKGIQLIHRQLVGLLAKEGITRIPTVGEAFDPHRHEAVGSVPPQNGEAEGTILEEVQVGYTMHDKVLRPALVKVAGTAEPGNPQAN